MDELPSSSIDDEEQQENMIEGDNNPHHQETISRQAYMPRLVVDFQQPNMQLTHFVQHAAAAASSNVPTRRHSSTQVMPPRSREQILQRYQNELQSLNGHWNSICIALTSIRSSYLAVLSSISTSESQQPSESSESPTASSTCTSSTSSPTPIQQTPITDFLIPSAVAVTSFMTSRSNITTQSDLEQELLLAVDDAMFQIRQLEVRIERLEAHIQELVQSVHHRQQ